MTNTKITRREILNLALASPLLAAMPDIGQAQAGKTKRLDRQSFVDAPSAITPLGVDEVKQVELIRQWRGPVCRSRLINRGKAPARIKEVTLFDLKLDLPPTRSEERRVGKECRSRCDWSSDVCSSDLMARASLPLALDQSRQGAGAHKRGYALRP